jgi:NTP pyrophosphatase (non-canonical NTP hydrolase)
MAEIRSEVSWFSGLMEKELKENDHKGGWQNESMEHMLVRLQEERDELVYAIDKFLIDKKDPREIFSEAADVANFAMMIADIARLQSQEVQANA